MIGVARGVLLDAADGRYILAAFEALLADRRPSAQLAQFIDGLRKTVANSGDSPARAGADARNVGGDGESADYALYDVLDTGEAAKVLGITANGVRDLARRKTIPAHRAGGRWLFPAAAIVDRAERRAAKRG